MFPLSPTGDSGTLVKHCLIHRLQYDGPVFKCSLHQVGCHGCLWSGGLQMTVVSNCYTAKGSNIEVGNTLFLTYLEMFDAIHCYPNSYGTKKPCRMALEHQNIF